MKVYKSSKVLILRPEIFSSTLGTFWAIFVFIVTLIAVVGGQRSGDFVDFFRAIYPFYGPNWLGLIFGPIWGFINGFLLGFFIGYIYTWLVRKKMEEVGEPVFDLDPDKDINIIQKGEGDRPYTIAFVANPAIYLPTYKITEQILQTMKKSVSDTTFTSLAELQNKIVRGDGEFLELLIGLIGEAETSEHGFKIMEQAKYFEDDTTFEADYIMDNKDIFFKVVIRCLRSFANNELLSLPEIFPRLRLIAIFENGNLTPAYNNALCEVFDPITDILAPRSDVSVITNYVDRFEQDVDVIFLISGSPKYIRSSAYFSHDESKKGKSFEFTFTDDLTNFDKKRIHAFYPKTPGVVALSAWDDRLKTSVHEFAHAMSSIENGAIVDEYIDFETATVLENNMVNKRCRASKNDPVPDVFAKYKPDGKNPKGEIIQYFSDRDRRDKDPEWISYVPERRKPYVSCIMDIAYFGFRFDKLIFDFMYDRLLTKLNRSK